jgi:hypothetical protein
VTRKDLITYVDAAPAVYPGVKEDLKVKAEKTELNSSTSIYSDDTVQL